MQIKIFDDVSDFLNKISESDAAKILANLKLLQENHTEGLVIKSLKGRIREIVVKQYRVIFFQINSTGYVVDTFRKRSKKTPKRILERAEKIYKDIINT